MTQPQKKELAERLNLPPMILAIEKATAVLILKQRQKLSRLIRVKDFKFKRGLRCQSQKHEGVGK